MGQITQYIPADRRSIVLPGTPADHTYQFSVQAFRRVHADISANGVLLSGTALSSPYQPTVTPAFEGDITGTIQGRDSLSVVQNLENIASDSVLSTTEKPGVILEYNRASSQLTALDARAAALNDYAAERNSAQTAFDDLTVYLNGLNPAWNDASVHTPIDGQTFQTKWATLYVALADLDAAITGRQGEPGEDGAPGSNGDNTAVLMLWKRSASAPTLPTNQAVWSFANREFTTAPNNGWSLTFPSVTGSADRVYSTTASIASPNSSVSIPSGLWTAPVAGIGGIGGLDSLDWANEDVWLGSDSTDTRPSNLVGLNGTESLLNADLSLSADGFLTYGPNVNIGAVNLSGLGYTGALNATRNTGALADLDAVNLSDLGLTSGTLPVTRANADLRNVNQTWAEVSGTGRPSDGATNDLGLRSIQGSATINGNTYTNTSTLGWVGHVTSDVIAGSVKARARVEHATARAFLGLYDSGALVGNSYMNLDYSIYLDAAGDYQAYENGVPTNLNQSGVVGDILEIEYLQDKVKYWITPVSTGVAVLKREVAAPAGKTFRLSSCAYYTAPDARSTPFSRISFTPTSDDTSVLLAGANATNASPAAVNFGGLSASSIDLLFRGSDSTLDGYTIANSVVSFHANYTEFSNANNAIGLRQFLPIAPDDIWEIEAVFEVVSGNSSVRLGFFGWNDAGTIINDNLQEGNESFPAGSRNSRKIRIGGSAVDSSLVRLNCSASTTRFVPHFRINVGASSNVRIYSLRATRINDYTAADIPETTTLRWAAESGADLTKAVTGVSAIDINYQSNGTTLQSGEIPKSATFSLQNADGTTVGSGVSWSVTTVSGTWSGAGPSASGSGVGQVTINSGLEVSEASIRVTAQYQGRTYSLGAKVQKKVAAASSSGSSGSSSDFAEDTTLEQIGSTTYFAISNDLFVTTQSGSTAVSLSAGGISLLHSNPNQAGVTDIQFKWQWWNGSSWVDVGSAASSNPDPTSIDEGGFYSSQFGSITCNATKTGLTASTEYKFRLMGRRASGVAMTVGCFGSVQAQG